jgi:hypothetical protein
MRYFVPVLLCVIAAWMALEAASVMLDPPLEKYLRALGFAVVAGWLQGSALFWSSCFSQSAAPSPTPTKETP